jgi:hypothetical protein
VRRNSGARRTNSVRRPSQSSAVMSSPTGGRAPGRRSTPTASRSDGRSPASSRHHLAASSGSSQVEKGTGTLPCLRRLKRSSSAAATVTPSTTSAAAMSWNTPFTPSTVAIGLLLVRSPCRPTGPALLAPATRFLHHGQWSRRRAILARRRTAARWPRRARVAAAALGVARTPVPAGVPGWSTPLGVPRPPTRRTRRHGEPDRRPDGACRRRRPGRRRARRAAPADVGLVGLDEGAVHRRAVPGDAADEGGARRSEAAVTVVIATA